MKARVHIFEPTLSLFTLSLLGLSLLGGKAAAEPDSGTYVVHPAGVLADCLHPTNAPPPRPSFLGIDVGCNKYSAADRRVVIVRMHSGFYTFRSPTDASMCATVARGVVFGAPSIDFLTCEGADSPCGAGARDQVFSISDGPNYLTYGRVDIGAAPFGAWDVGDYGDQKEVKYWLPDNGRPAKQRFTLDRVGPAPAEFAACQGGPVAHRPLPLPRPKPPALRPSQH